MKKILYNIVKPSQTGQLTDQLRWGISQLNILILVGIAYSILGGLTYYYWSMPISALTNLILGICLLPCFIANKRGHYNFSRIISLLVVGIYIATINYIEGLKAGNYLLYFPYFIALTFLTGLHKISFWDIVIYLVTMAGVCTIFTDIVPYKVSFQNIPLDTYIKLYNFNLASSLMLSFAFAYMILKGNESKENALLEQQQFFDAVYNTSSDAVLIVDAATDSIVDCNDQTLQMFELQGKQSLIGTTSKLFFDTYSHTIIEHIHRFKNSRHWGWTGEVHLATANEKPFIGRVQSITYKHNAKRYKKISVTDITQARLFQQELVAAREKAEEAAVTKSRFLSNMSHELRTPLNGIIGVSNLLLQEDFLPHQKEQFQVLKFSSEHMLELINDLLDLNKIEANKMLLEHRAFSLQELLTGIQKTFEAQYAKKGILLKVMVDERIDAEILSDSVRLNQVLSNLLANALKFTPAGSVELRAELLQIMRDTYQVKLAVADTGIGIEADKLDHIFDSFIQADVATTRQFGGTGLGLAICKKLVELFGGNLTVQSKPGRGSTFSFTLDFKINQQRTQLIHQQQDIPANGLQGKKILVAEDNPINMLVARKFLQKWGAEVTEAGNGAEALALVQQQCFDIMLIDLEMPVMDGFEAIKAIRELPIYTPAIAFTAAVLDNQLYTEQTIGFTDFVYKPFQPKELYQKIIDLTVAAHSTVAV